MGKIEDYEYMLATENCDMAWPEAWDQVIYPLLDAIKQYVIEKNIRFEIVQIKEKFAGLRFYYTGGDEHVSNLIKTAEKTIQGICQRCKILGDSNDISYYRDNGCYRMVCAKCKDKLKWAEMTAKAEAGYTFSLEENNEYTRLFKIMKKEFEAVDGTLEL